MKKIKINIPNMQSTHCETQVMSALDTLKGISVDHIRPGFAEITIRENGKQPEVMEAIQKAGYTITGVETVYKSSVAEDTLLFKTNINCAGCVAKVSPALNAMKGILDWCVDTTNADKILKVETSGISEEEIIATVKKTGFSIVPKDK